MAQEPQGGRQQASEPAPRASESRHRARAMRTLCEPRLPACGLGRRGQEGVSKKQQQPDEQQAAGRERLGLERAGGALGDAVSPGARPVPHALEEGAGATGLVPARPHPPKGLRRGGDEPVEDTHQQQREHCEQGERASDLILGWEVHAQEAERRAEDEAAEATAHVRVPVDAKARVRDLAQDPQHERLHRGVGRGGCCLWPARREGGLGAGSLVHRW